ncbi:MAG: glycosyltransferase family 4 protein [Gemmatimonadales bacterium]|nr:glycosyltransferase family 4 protein [Gemmatimonadales bacterium]
MDPHVLFVSHDASRTGASLLLLHFLQWLRRSTDIPFEVLLRRDGPLAEEFAALSPVIHVAHRPQVSRLLRRAFRRPGPVPEPGVVDLRDLERVLRKWPIGLIYSNTVTNGQVLRALAPLGCPVLTHAHELEHSIRTFASQDDFRLTLERSAKFIAGSDAVGMHLQARYAVPADRIATIRPFIDTDDWIREPSDRGEGLRSALGIGPECFVVGAIGTVDWRKGADIFVQVANVVQASRGARDVHFVWIGAYDEARLYELMFDVKRFGLDARVHFTGPRTEKELVRDIRAFDLFCLPSREEPFGLVLLEAACQELPIVCFANAGGAPEFVESDCGFVVPYLDVHSMAGRIVELIAAPALRASLGRTGKAKAIARHDVTVLAPQIVSQIRLLLSA